MKSYLIIITIFFLFLACEEKSPISEDKFIQIYAHLISVPDSVSVDSLKFSEYKKRIFSDFNCSEEDYELTVKYYNQKPEKWDEFFKNVIKYIETKDDSSKSEL